MPKAEMRAAPALVLFDIDGTLIRRAGPQHREALVKAIHQVTGLDTTTDGIPLHGMLDPQIVVQMLRDAGASPPLIRKSVPAIVRKAETIYLRTCPSDLTRKLCPGVRQTLDRLRRNGIMMGLVTGNLTKIAWKKMECAGLDEYFDFGACGGMSEDRAGLVRLAVSHARRNRLIRRGAPVTVIGDSPNDVRAARINDVRVIAVRTGISPPEELKRLVPDYMLEDLRQFKVEMVL